MPKVRLCYLMLLFLLANEDSKFSPRSSFVNSGIGAAAQFGTPDDSPAFQAALDNAEAVGRQLVLPPGTTVNLRGTVYIGDVTIRARGAIINVFLDDRFTKRGTARRRDEGAILTKSATGAGYAKATVRIGFNQLNIRTVRSKDAGGLKTGILLENVSRLKGDTLFASARGTGRSEVNPLDLYSGVQGVSLNRVYIRMHNPGAHGGFWIRNFSPTRDTANIRIGALDLAGATGDELLSIFNSGNPRADLHDIHIGSVDARPSGGGGMGMSIYRNAGGWDPRRMKHIVIDKVSIVVGDIGPLASTTGGFALKVQKCVATIKSVSVIYNGKWTTKLPYVFGIRYAPAEGQKKPLYIPQITIQLLSRNIVPTLSAAMLHGPIKTDRLFVRSRGSGFRMITHGAYEIKAAYVQGVLPPGDLFYKSRVIRSTINGLKL